MKNNRSFQTQIGRDTYISYHCCIPEEEIKVPSEKCQRDLTVSRSLLSYCYGVIDGYGVTLQSLSSVNGCLLGPIFLCQTRSESATLFVFFLNDDRFLSFLGSSGCLKQSVKTIGSRFSLFSLQKFVIDTSRLGPYRMVGTGLSQLYYPCSSCVRLMLVIVQCLNVACVTLIKFKFKTYRIQLSSEFNQHFRL